MSSKILWGIAASTMLTLLPGMAIAQSSTARLVDPPQQVDQLRQKFEGLTPEQIRAAGYAPEGPCIPSPHGVGAMGTHAINRALYEAQIPTGTEDGGAYKRTPDAPTETGR